MAQRELTAGETSILKTIQQEYGPHNAADDVFFTDCGEAAIFVKRPDGSLAVMANLTNLAAWRADGTIASDEELKKEWLRTQSG